MNKILYWAIVIFAGYQAYQKIIGPEPLPRLSGAPYVVVYGRDSCSVTRGMREDLTAHGTPFLYEVVDEPAVANELHARMQAQGLNIRRYNLPVVDVNGVLSVRPASVQVTALFNTGS